MSDQPTPETPERDSFRRLAEDAIEFFGDEDEGAEFVARRDALLAVEDKHPPVFHIRGGKRMVSRQMHTEWRWVAERNGRKLYGSTESYEHRQHAIDQAHEVADPLGARVLDDEGHEV